MAAFLYRAVDAQGRKSKGVIDAANAAAARQTLRARRLLPISVEPTSQAAAARGAVGGATVGGGGLSLPGRSARLGGRGLTLVTRQLATLIGSGVRVEDALKTVADQSRKSAHASLLLNLRAAILDGRSFAQALSDYPGVFGEFYRASVAAGENSGQLGEVMEHLAGFVENRTKNRQTVQLALLYPALLAVVSMGVVIALLTYVVPDIVKVFTSRGAELPFLTRSLIAISDGLNRYGVYMAMVLAGGVLGGGWLLRRPAIRRGWHRFLARAPLFRTFTLKTNAAQFSGTLATLTVSRVPLTDALAAAGDTVPNLFIREKVAGVSGRVREGVALSTALTEAGVFPPLLIAMVASGESSGALGKSLARAAADQSRDLDALVSALVALVEPAVLLIMGGVVMLLVMSILLPIVNLNNLVG